jgi:hypothetical protein
MLAVGAVVWYSSAQAMNRREAETERQRATYKAAQEREAAITAQDQTGHEPITDARRREARSRSVMG